MATPLRSDPSRTLTLRKKYEREMRRRFAVLKRQVIELVALEDVFGLRAQRAGLASLVNARGDDGASLQVNTRFAGMPPAEQLQAFGAWMEDVIERELLGPEDLPWMEDLINDSYAKGGGRAYADVRRIELLPQEYAAGGKTEFLRGMLGGPVGTERVKALAARNFTELKGVTQAMAQQIKRELIEGLVLGEHPSVVARRLTNRLDKIGVTRARTIARTEIIRAHAEGQLDAFELLQQQQIKILAEWSTAGDDRVCPLCLPMDGRILTIKEARGTIPLHPNCRCVFIPTV